MLFKFTFPFAIIGRTKMDYEIKQSIIKKSKERESGLSLSMSSSTFKITEASQNFIFK
jgi:hypothetical protein